MIACPDNQTVNTKPSQAYATVVWTNPQVTDNSQQNSTITCDANSGDQFEIGETEVTCQAVDPTGNQAICAFTVMIEGKSIISISQFYNFGQHCCKKSIPYGKIIPRAPVTMLKHEIMLLVTYQSPTLKGGGGGGIPVCKRL